jgi:hypothetical protein
MHRKPASLNLAKAMFPAKGQQSFQCCGNPDVFGKGCQVFLWESGATDFHYFLVFKEIFSFSLIVYSTCTEK